MANISVIIPTHNPDPRRLARTLKGLCAQTLATTTWDLIVVDNDSTEPLTIERLPGPIPPATRLVREEQLGLTQARRRGLQEATGEFAVLVDDDNVLAPDYLAQVEQIFAAYPTIGAIGGRSLPEFETAPAPWWQPEFDGLIACRDLGASAIIAEDRRDPRTGRRQYPHCAPVGAGMALRRRAFLGWLERQTHAHFSDRRGSELTSGGDNDISLTLLQQGWLVGYFPALSLKHLIPSGRVQRDYLARLNYGIAKSWVQVLQHHEANPWPAVPPWTVPLRQLKAWFAYRAWSGPAQFIRWRGACGHFAGLATLHR